MTKCISGTLNFKCLSKQTLREFTHPSSFDHPVQGVRDEIGVVMQIHVTQHIGGAEEHGRRIGHIFADSFAEGVSRALQENDCSKKKVRNQCYREGKFFKKKREKLETKKNFFLQTRLTICCSDVFI